MSRAVKKNDDALRAALAILDEPLPRSRRFVTYESRGCVLVMGAREATLGLAEVLRHQMEVVALIDEPKPASRFLGMTVMTGRVQSIDGYLGRFSVQAQGLDGEPIDLGAKSTNEDGYFDVVMDLSAAPLIDREIVPPGYFQPIDAAHYQTIIDAVPALIGESHKPKYFEFLDERCVHRRQQVPGCDRCIDVCPAHAIASDKQTVEVDPHLCQGCGSCTVMCPTGSLIYSDPALSEITERLARALQAFRSTGGVSPWIGFHDCETAGSDNWASEQGVTVVPFALHSVTSLGLETWLVAIGLGAAGVVVAVSDSAPATAVATLQQQMELAHTILEGTGHPRERLCLLHSDNAQAREPDIAKLSGVKPDPAWTYDTSTVDTRERLLNVFARLSDTAKVRPPQAAVDLAEWAPFGRVIVDPDACTMCLACVNLCPTAALRADDNGAELAFREAVCVQCGLCERGCPEGAIKRHPRFDYQALQTQDMIVLNRAAMAKCSECGRPFMPANLLTSASKRLRGDSDTIRHAKAMLKVCPQCRADSALRSQFPPGRDIF
jgi:ferredoxin